MKEKIMKMKIKILKNLTCIWEMNKLIKMNNKLLQILTFKNKNYQIMKKHLENFM